MNNFCQVLAYSLREEFETEIDVFVWKKKKKFSYKFFKEVLKFIKNYWYRRQKFYPGYFFVYPKLNQCLK